MGNIRQRADSSSSDLSSLSSVLDSEEDRIMLHELQRLEQSNGEAPPLWSAMPEFTGMSHATRSWTQHNRSSQDGQGGRGG